MKAILLENQTIEIHPENVAEKIVLEFMADEMETPLHIKFITKIWEEGVEGYNYE